MVQLLSILSAVFLVLFLLVYHNNKSTLWNGILFLCFLLPAGLVLVLLALDTGYAIFSMAVVFMIFLLGFLFLFGAYIAIALLLLNARKVAKHERRSLGNSLTLISAVLLTAALLSAPLLSALGAPGWLWALWAGLLAVLVVYLFILAIFLLTLWLANLALPRKNQRYIIVLGSGLIGGEVPPLLANRIDRAIRFYQKQKKRRTPPTLVMSGGQGPDEPRSEAAAMREYALAHGVAAEHILVEDSSTTTAENMRFSKQLIEFTEHGKPAACLYATSNYHLLRAGRIARAEGLKITGLGSRTALYYLPNAILREFIAIIWMAKRRNALIAGATFLLTTGLVLAVRYIGLPF